MPIRAESWGTTPAEEARPLPCDALLPDARLVLHRAVDVAAPPALVFRWLCQLRAAPYSYDLLDNLGRRSPRRLTPGLDELAVGQRVMTVFRLVSFAAPEHLTVRYRGAGGHVVSGYAVTPDGDGSRLVNRIRWTPPAVPLLPAALAWGDLLMARRQLLTLAALAGRDAAAR